VFSRLTALSIACFSLYAADVEPDPRNVFAARLIEQGRFVPAAGLLRQVYEDARKAGVETEHLADTAADLAGAYIALDRYRDAEPLVEEALAIDRKLFGEDAPQTARHSLVLAKLYLLTGRVRQAEPMLLRARPILEAAFGADSIKVAGLLNHLGLANDMLGRLSESAACYRQAIRIYESTESQKRLAGIVRSNLIAVLMDLGRYEEAAQAGETALALLENWFGKDHPYVARTLHGLGTVYQGQNRVDDAQRLYERALTIWEKNPDVGVLDAATVQASLGTIYTYHGYFAKAEALLAKAVSTRESLLGPNHVEISYVLNNLGYMYGAQGRLSEARKALERAKGIAEDTIGTAHPRCTPILSNLAWVYFSEGRYSKDGFAKSEAIYRRVLAIQEKRFGPDAIEVSNTLASLAEACAAQKHYREAKQVEGRALAIRQAVLGSQHPETVKVLKQYTFLLRKSKD
jgi:tetratricopeptide (TPR) repeat protein